MTGKIGIELTVNGQAVEEVIDNRLLLVDFLRERLSLTGTHIGCTFEGVCGACTVLVDGEAVKSCMMLAAQADGRAVTTIEGLGADGQHPLQAAFHDRHALQCGFCTPGILMNMAEFLSVNPEPSEAEVREALVGNLCRCTGYTHIVEAVLQAAEAMRADAREVVHAAE